MSASIAKVIEIIALSTVGFDDALRQGLARANQTLGGVSGAWIKEQSVELKDGQISYYKLILKVTFVVDGDSR